MLCLLPISPGSSASVAAWSDDFLGPWQQKHGPLPDAFVDFIAGKIADSQLSLECSKLQECTVSFVLAFSAVGACSTHNVAIQTADDLPSLVKMLAVWAPALLTSGWCVLHSTDTHWESTTRLAAWLLYLKKFCTNGSTSSSTLWRSWLALLPGTAEATNACGLWTPAELQQLQLEPFKVSYEHINPDELGIGSTHKDSPSPVTMVSGFKRIQELVIGVGCMLHIRPVLPTADDH